MAEIGIIGKKIIGIRALTKAEKEVEGWDGDEETIAIELEDGTLIYPSVDEEGNYGGVLFGNQKGKSFTISAGEIG